MPLEAVWDWGSVEGQTIKSEASLCLMDNSQLCLEYEHDAKVQKRLYYPCNRKMGRWEGRVPTRGTEKGCLPVARAQMALVTISL